MLWLLFEPEVELLVPSLCPHQWCSRHLIRSAYQSSRFQGLHILPTGVGVLLEWRRLLRGGNCDCLFPVNHPMSDVVVQVCCRCGSASLHVFSFVVMMEVVVDQVVVVVHQ